MKRFVSILAALALCLCLAAPAAADAAPASLKFNKPEGATDGTFKIIQVADPQDFILSCQITQDFIYDLAKTEKPDLFVLTGDNVSTGGASKLPKFLAKALVWLSVQNLMHVFDRVYKEFGIPMTMVYGNHDNEAGPSKVSREEQFEMYKKHKCFLGYYDADADGGTEDEQGQHYGTHKLAIKNSAGDADAFNIWMFDSGSYDIGGGYSCVQQPQVDWFNSANTARLPSIAFQHIIVKEIWDILEDAAQGDPGAIPRKITVDGEEVTTYIKLPDAPNVTGGLREVPGPGGRNFGQYQALCDGGVLALFVGHDHVNTYQFKYTDKTDLVNSPCTGFGSYGDIDLRGARIITLKESDLTTYETSLVSFQTFYYFTGHPLRDARLKMYQSMGTPATLLDWLSFKPLLWVLGLFDK